MDKRKIGASKGVTDLDMIKLAKDVKAFPLERKGCGDVPTGQVSLEITPTLLKQNKTIVGHNKTHIRPNLISIM